MTMSDDEESQRQQQELAVAITADIQGGGGNDEEIIMVSSPSSQNFGNKDDGRDETASISITDSIDDALSHSQNGNGDDPAEHHDVYSSNKRHNDSRRRILCLLLVLSVVAFAVGLGAGLSYKNDNRSSTKEATLAADDPTTNDPASGTTVDNFVESVEEDPTDPTEDSTVPPVVDADKDEDLSLELAEDQMVFPELVGMDANEAKALLETHYPGRYEIYILPEDASITMDFVLHRIRLFVDVDTNLITRPPKVG